MKQVLIKNGQAVLEDVPAPQLGNKHLLVRVDYSCISAGTELAGLQASRFSMYKLALKQPQLIWKAVESVREEGWKRTLDKITGQTAMGFPTGYAAAGVVLETGSEVVGFKAGDRVACAGAGIANHAEIIHVPVNLATPIPAELDSRWASTVTLGSIALHGVRRAQVTLGETIVVMGLGLIGQLVCRFLGLQGCRVIATDLDSNRLQMARDGGADCTIDLRKDNLLDCVRNRTEGTGADAAIITASSQSDEVIQQAMHCCRKKGRVVLVGDVGLNLNRDDFYAKELDLLISTSYGPGRYDPIYEQGGHDYPLPYVRWTEGRNMQEYLRLLAEKRIDLDRMPAKEYAIDHVAEAYQALQQSEDKPLVVFLHYPQREESLQRTVRMVHSTRIGRDQVRVALVGAGGFAKGMLLPTLKQLSQTYLLKTVMSRTGSNAKNTATQYGAETATTDYEAILNDPAIDLVLIATRHHLHGKMVLQALQAGKNVLVEKPLCLTDEELRAIESFFNSNPKTPLLMTGFNRRFSPAMQKTRELLHSSTTPLMLNYRMNAGYIPVDHWVHGAEGGGRNIGEACHIYDLFSFFTNSEVDSIAASSIQPNSKQWRSQDNFVATTTFQDGSVCTLTYTALGDSTYPKERMEIFADSKVIFMDNFHSLEISGRRKPVWKSSRMEKGHLQEFQALAESLTQTGKWPIPLRQQIQTTRISFEVEKRMNK